MNQLRLSSLSSANYTKFGRLTGRSLVFALMHVPRSLQSYLALQGLAHSSEAEESSVDRRGLVFNCLEGARKALAGLSVTYHHLPVHRRSR